MHDFLLFLQIYGRLSTGFTQGDTFITAIFLKHLAIYRKLCKTRKNWRSYLRQRNATLSQL